MDIGKENGLGPKSEAASTLITANHRQEASRISDDIATPPHRRWSWLVSRSLLLDCGCREVCHCEVSLTDHELDGWALAARTLLSTAKVLPIVPVEVRRALWRRGGEDRVLVEILNARSAA